MGWIGPTAAVHQYLAVVGADRGADGRYIVSGEPVSVVDRYGEMVVPDGTLYFVRGASAPLAVGLASTSQGTFAQTNPAARVNPEDFARALIAEDHRWQYLDLDDGDYYDPDEGLWVAVGVDCPDSVAWFPEGTAEDDEDDARQAAVEATQVRMGQALRKFLDAEWAATLEGQQVFGGRGWGRRTKPTWPGSVTPAHGDYLGLEFEYRVDIPIPQTVGELGRTLYVLGRLDAAIPHLMQLCGVKPKAKTLTVPERKAPRTAVTPEYKEALKKHKEELEAGKRAEERRKAIEKLKKGHYRVGPIGRTGAGGYRIPILYRGKEVADMFIERDGRRMVSMSKFSWAGPHPQSVGFPANSPESALFYDGVFPLGTSVEDTFAGGVERLEKARKWRADYKKTPAAKERTAMRRAKAASDKAKKHVEADKKAAKKKAAKKKAAKKKPAKKKPAKEKPAPKKPAKKKAAKKKPAAKKKAAKKKAAKKKPAARRVAAKKPARPKDPTDLLAMARWAREGNPGGDAEWAAFKAEIDQGVWNSGSYSRLSEADRRAVAPHVNWRVIPMFRTHPHVIAQEYMKRPGTPGYWTHAQAKETYAAETGEPPPRSAAGQRAARDRKVAARKVGYGAGKGRKAPSQKKAPTARTSRRAAAKRPARPPDPSDLLAMARWARGEE